MTRADRHLRLGTIATALSLAVVVVTAFALGHLDGVEGRLYDVRAARFQYFTPPPSDRVVHVDIDDATLDAVGAWPWPRSQMAALIDEMSTAGAKVIALDVLYTEPQQPELVADGPLMPDGKPPAKVKWLDHDAELAGSFRRAGNVLLPASLSFVSGRTQNAAIDRALAILSADLDVPVGRLRTMLVAERFADTDVADAEANYFTLRREAALARVEAELAKPPATAPTTSPSTAPTTAPADVRVALRAALFPSADPRVNSPQSRLVDEAYDKFVATRTLDRFGRPPVPGVSAFVPRGELAPVAKLIDAAAYGAFVDYPLAGDGTVRSVPLFVNHRGQLFPQMGLRIACAMMDVDPKDVTITPDAVTIPAGTGPGGKPRPALTIPVRTGEIRRASGKTTDLPLTMDIPWFGPGRWWAMYDPAHPEARRQHLPLSVVYDAVKTRQKIVTNCGKVDDAIIFLLGQQRTGGKEWLALNPERADAYVAARPAEDDVAGRAAIMAYARKLVADQMVVEQFDSFDPAAMTPAERTKVESFRIHFANLNAAAAELPRLQSQLNAQRVELRKALDGKAALVGWTAVAVVADQKPTPLHAAAPGVVVHGTIATALLGGDVWRTLTPWWTAAVALLLGVLTALSVAYLKPAWALAASLALAAGYVTLNCLALFDYGNVILGLTAPALAVTAAWAGGTIARLMIEGREKARITRRFATYVDPDLVNYVLESRDESILTGQRRETAVVFTDLEGFTSLSEKLGEDVIPVLNDFMGRAVTVIKRHKGFVNKFLGDGILFFFNAPRPNAKFVGDAVDAILDLQEMLKGFNDDLVAQKLPRVRLRAGVTTGNVIVGDAGSQGRADYTVIGDLVNLAARLESANKFFGTASLVSEETVRQAGDAFLFRPVGVIQVVGRQAGEPVFEAMGWAKDATDEQRELVKLTKAVVDAFRAGDAAGCLAAVANLEVAGGQTKLTKAYRAAAEPYATGEREGKLPAALVLDAK